ncbi:MAG: hypothetical protein A2147_03280 [Chloroflexi bacterium RBG_16_57_8]|nr:MAG: hypothetical protein A2147_03280 [Chloroflexi bacterium RBG_16_57_8]
MGTSAMALVFFMVILMLAATVAVLTVVYATRLPSRTAMASRVKPVPLGESAQAAAPPQPDHVGRRSESDPQGPGPAGEKPADADPASVTEPPAIREGSNPIPSERSETQSDMKNIFSSKRARPDEGNNAQPALAAQADIQPAPSAPPKAETARPLPPGTPQQMAIHESNPEGKPHNPPAASATAPAAVNATVQIAATTASGKENQVSTDVKPTDTGKTGSVPPAAKPQAASLTVSSSGRAGDKTPETQKSNMGDLSDLFAKATDEDSKAGKLAEKMGDVDVNDLLKEGLGLVGRLKRK